MSYDINRGCLHTYNIRGNLFNLARLRAKTKVRHVVIREMIFADDAALVTHRIENLQQLMDTLPRRQGIWTDYQHQENKSFLPRHCFTFINGH